MKELPTAILPHRPPFLFIDRVLDHDEQSVTAVRTFRPEEDFFRGHFPGNPIVPGVLLLEGMAQAVGFLVLAHAPGKVVYLTGIDRARFRKPVLPGQEVVFHVRIEGTRLGVVRVRGEARVEGTRVADAVLSGFVGDPPAEQPR